MNQPELPQLPMASDSPFSILSTSWLIPRVPESKATKKMSSLSVMGCLGVRGQIYIPRYIYIYSETRWFHSSYPSIPYSIIIQKAKEIPPIPKVVRTTRSLDRTPLKTQNLPNQAASALQPPQKCRWVIFGSPARCSSQGWPTRRCGHALWDKLPSRYCTHTQTRRDSARAGDAVLAAWGPERHWDPCLARSRDSGSLPWWFGIRRQNRRWNRPLRWTKTPRWSVKSKTRVAFQAGWSWQGMRRSQRRWSYWGSRSHSFDCS